MNCYIKFDLAQKAGKSPSFLSECKGKRTKFGDISKYAIQFKIVKKKKGPKPNLAVAPAKPSNDVNPEADDSEDSDSG